MKKKLGLTVQEKKVLSFWGIALLILIIGLSIFSILFPEKGILAYFRKNKNVEYKYAEVSNFSRYSTVTTAIEKYYSFINMKDYNSVLKILDEDYIKEKNITSTNIKNNIYIPDGLVSFNPGIMYGKSKNGIMTYLVEGTVENFSTGEIIKKEYLKVILDGNTFHFSVRPIDEKEYKEVSNG